MFEYTPRSSGPKKQNPVPLRDTPRAPQGHIRGDGKTAPVCAPQGHIGSSGRCAPQGHISRLPLSEEKGRPLQGSSTVRAPAQAGGAGSSPAPVANPAFTEWHGVGSFRYRLSDDPRAMEEFCAATQARMKQGGGSSLWH
jgi:hypothetical protein